MDILIKSVIGGLTIASILFSSRYFGTTLAGVLTAIPIIFTFSFFTGIYGKEEVMVQNYLFNTFISAIFTVGFLGVLYFLTKQNFEKLNLNLLLAYGVYFLAVIVWLKFQNV